MENRALSAAAHLAGKHISDPDQPQKIDSFSGVIHIEWNPYAAVTLLGLLPFFIDFIKTAQLFEPWINECPLSFTSPNAPKKTDLLGTIFLSVLAGHNRYTHITALRSDGVNPELLGISKVCSEDSIRRAFENIKNTEIYNIWLHNHLLRPLKPLFYEPWILDVDSTIKTVYGTQQEGAVIGYNPKKPGRPSHTYHTYFIANIRLIIDVDVQDGNKTAPKNTLPGLFDFLKNLPKEAYPQFIRGDIAFGNENIMNRLEEIGLDYLFKLRYTKGVRQLINKIFDSSDWEQAGQGFEGTKSQLKLKGWSKKRNIVILRQQISKKKKAKSKDQLILFNEEIIDQNYEYTVLITSLDDTVLTIAQHYRDRADCENNFDELKNQWGWSGFTTKDIFRCQIMARIIAVVYNWWTLFTRLAIPTKHAEAITSRPLLLQAIAKMTRHSGQTKLTITSTHAEQQRVKIILHGISSFLSQIRQTSELLDWDELWGKILSRIFIGVLQGRPLSRPTVPLLSSASTLGSQNDTPP